MSVGQVAVVVRSVLHYRPVILAIAIAVCGLWSLTSGILGQRAQTPLEIGEMSHTVVNDRSVIVIGVSNTGQTALTVSGEFELVDSSGAEFVRTPVDAGEIEARQDSVIAIPLNRLLPPGRYTATLLLVDEDEAVRANSGMREITIGGFRMEPTPTVVPTSVPPASVEDDTDGAGFPSWLLLLIGITLTVAGIGYMRLSSGTRTPPSPRPVPEVSMVRKVKVDARPVKRPATIKPLLPPRRRED